ncbi:MAG: hypothetical protein ACOYW3_16465 [Bacteroidota bacterium]
MKHIYWLILFGPCAWGQTQWEVFVRAPQIVSYQFKSTELSYSPGISCGFTFRHKVKFADVGSFVTSTGSKGHYIYFGSALMSHSSTENWIFVLNWFGEPTWLSSARGETSPWIGTVGVSPVLIKPIAWGAFAIALTTGVTLHQERLSFNNRLILNYSLPIKKRMN